jgi:hypothetical protein
VGIAGKNTRQSGQVHYELQLERVREIVYRGETECGLYLNDKKLMMWGKGDQHLVQSVDS